MFTRLSRLLITLSVVCAGAVGATTASSDVGVSATGGWDRPVKLARVVVGDVDVAPNGDMAVVIPRAAGVVLRERPSGGAWGTPTAVPGTQKARELRAAYDGDSLLSVAWLERRGTARRVLTSHELPGGGWSTPEVVAVRRVGWFSELQLTVNIHGDAAVGWVWRREGVGFRLLIAQSSAGVWGAVARLGEVAMFELALGDDGHAAVVMNRFEGKDPSVTEIVTVVRQRPSGEWGPARVLVRIPDVTFYVGMGSVAVDGAGTTTVVWRGQSADGDWQLLAARGRVGHRWEAPVALDPRAGAVHESPPQVKAASDGSVTAFWIHRDRSLRAARHQAGGDWAHQVVVTREIGTYVWDADVDPSGRAVAIWAERGWFGEPGAGLRARLMNRRGTWGAVANITLPNARLYYPKVAMGHGDALAVWQHVVDSDTSPTRASVHLAGSR
ncbi:MAG TPA: hypothetical protein PLP61_05220 [Nocardioides sp.]|uniref:hypothetical protein n=1 Tax=Nocardioides sp. TaxID=35761 RepID=UPI002C9233B0|nr:hypothetical protein [Nocardioides sp.]HQR26422.1 hypothetical protein [Nocardioides sp.]